MKAAASKSNGDLRQRLLISSSGELREVSWDMPTKARFKRWAGEPVLNVALWAWGGSSKVRLDIGVTEIGNAGEELGIPAWEIAAQHAFASPGNAVDILLHPDLPELETKPGKPQRLRPNQKQLDAIRRYVADLDPGLRWAFECEVDRVEQESNSVPFPSEDVIKMLRG